jgi:hypothetical protein
MGMMMGPQQMQPLVQRLMQMRQQGAMNPGNTNPGMTPGQQGNSMPQGQMLPPQMAPQGPQQGGMMGSVAPQDPMLARKLMMLRQQQMQGGNMQNGMMPGQTPMTPQMGQ